MARAQAGAAVAFLAKPLVDEHVGIDRHAEHEHEAGQAGQREGGIDGDHEAHGQQQVGQQCDAGDQAGEAVVDEHEDQDGGEGQADRDRPLKIVSAPRVAPMVFSLTGSRIEGGGELAGAKHLDVAVHL